MTAPTVLAALKEMGEQTHCLLLGLGGSQQGGTLASKCCRAFMFPTLAMDCMCAKQKML